MRSMCAWTIEKVPDMSRRRSSAWIQTRGLAFQAGSRGLAEIRGVGAALGSQWHRVCRGEESGDETMHGGGCRPRMQE